MIRRLPPYAVSNHVRRILRVPNDKFVDVNDSQIETIFFPASPRRFQQFVDCRPPVPNDPVCDSRVEANRELKRFGPAPPTRIPGPVIWVIYRENVVWPDPVVWVISRENVVWPVFLALEYILGDVPLVSRAKI